MEKRSRSLFVNFAAVIDRSEIAASAEYPQDAQYFDLQRANRTTKAITGGSIQVKLGKQLSMQRSCNDPIKHGGRQTKLSAKIAALFCCFQLLRARIKHHLPWRIL